MPESQRRGRMNLGRRLWSLRNKSNNRLPGRGSDHMILARLFKALSLPKLFTCGRALRRSATKKAHISCKSLGNDKALKRRAKVNRRWRGGSGSGNFCKARRLKLNSRTGKGGGVAGEEGLEAPACPTTVEGVPRQVGLMVYGRSGKERHYSEERDLTSI
jgi:hypothetical protein